MYIITQYTHIISLKVSENKNDYQCWVEKLILTKQRKYTCMLFFVMVFMDNCKNKVEYCVQSESTNL